MKGLLQALTDRIATKKGMWITLAIWFAMTMILALFAPSVKDYQVTSVDTLPDDVQSVIAQKKVDTYFSNNDGLPAILVFQQKDGSEIQLSDLVAITEKISSEKIDGVEQVIPLSQLPPQAVEGFYSEDKATAILPLT